MSNIEKAMAHLRVIYAYTAFARKRGTSFLGLQVICDIEERASDALTLLEEQDEQIKLLEHQAVDNKGKFNAHETLIGKALDAGHVYR